MSYIGNTPAENYASFLTETFSVSATANYTLSHAVANENDIRLVINGVVQQPGSGKAYTASGTTLTLTSATASGDVMYAVYLGRALQTVNAPNASVGSDQTAPTIITGQTAETSIATDDTILIHDTSASALRKMTRANFVSGIGGTNTPAFLAYNNSADTISNSSYTKVEFDTEVYDTASAFDTTNDKFVVPSGQGGYYTLYGVVNARNTSDQLRTIQIIFYKNGSRINSKYDFASVNNSASASGIFRGFSLGHTITVNLSASDYIEVYTYLTVSAGSPMVDEGSIFGGYKLIT